MNRCLSPISVFRNNLLMFLQEVLKSVPKFVFPYSTYQAQYVYCIVVVNVAFWLHMAGLNSCNWSGI